MRYFQRKTLRQALSLCLLSVAGCGSPGYNDNPSQQITTDRVGCLASTGFFPVYFSTHVKPTGETPSSNIDRTRFRAYCGDLPEPGEVFFTADLIDPETRKTPIAIRVVEQASAGVGAGSTESPGVARTLLDLPPQRFEKGVIESTFTLDSTGQYAIYLIRQESNGGRELDRLTIPLTVGSVSSTGFRERILAPQFLLLMSLGLAGITIFLKAYRFNPMKKP